MVHVDSRENQQWNGEERAVACCCAVVVVAGGGVPQRSL